MKWTVKHYDYDIPAITDYDLFPYFEAFLLKLKKQRLTREEFTKEIKSELMYHYWSKCEYEIFIEKADDGRIYLLPHCGGREKDTPFLDVTDDTSFDWKGFAEMHIKMQIYGNKAKIDIWNQIEYRFDEFIDYCWDGIHKRKSTLKKGKVNEI